MGGFEIKVHVIAQDTEKTSDVDPGLVTEVILAAYIQHLKLDRNVHWTIYDQELETTLDLGKTLAQNGVKDDHHLYIRRSDDAAEGEEAERKLRKREEQESRERERIEAEDLARAKAEEERKAREQAERDRSAREQEARERRLRLIRRLLVAAALLMIVGIGGYLPVRFLTPSKGELNIKSTLNGAELSGVKIAITGNPDCTTPCAVSLPAGNYTLTLETDRIYQAWAQQGVVVSAGQPTTLYVPLTRLTPRPTNITWSGTGSRETVIFGTGSCHYSTVMDNVQIRLLVNQNGQLLAGRVTALMHESLISGSCQPALGTNSHSYALARGSINGTQVSASFTPSPANGPKCSATFNGSIVNGRLVGILTFRRIDSTSYVFWTTKHHVD